MDSRILTGELIRRFEQYLRREERSPATIEKYLRDVGRFCDFARGECVNREVVIAYKNMLLEKYAVSSVNSILASLSSFFRFLEWDDCRVRSLRQQRRPYCPEEKELSREEYFRLLAAAGEGSRLNLLLQTICGTGIRVSELRYFTVEDVKQGEIVVSCKNKTRVILIPGKLRKMLLSFAKRQGIRRGAIFITRSGRPMDRSNIWAQMKKLCIKAKVQPGKVFPHNLRKLFARCFYKIEKDIGKLADILGHSNINTTRIYIMTTGLEHRRQMEQLRLVI